MAELNQKTDIGELGQQLHERLKELRLVPERVTLQAGSSGPQTEGVVHTPSDAELFVGTVRRRTHARRCFAGDDATFRALENARFRLSREPQRHWEKLSRTFGCFALHTVFSLWKIALAVGVLLVVAVLIYQFIIHFAINTPWSAPKQSQKMRNRGRAIAPTAVKQCVRSELRLNKSTAVERLEPARVRPRRQLYPHNLRHMKSAQQLYLNEDY
jgi:hypothetical protein